MSRLSLGLVLVLALAALLRGFGLPASLPQRCEGDASFVVQSQLLRSGAAHPERNEQFGRYPLLVPFLDQLVPSRGVEPAPPGSALEQHLRAAGRVHLRLRWIVAVLACALVPGTYALARIFLVREQALFAAFLSATSLLHLAFSQQARPHAASVPFVVLGVLACIHLGRRGTPARYLAAGAAIGLALATLQSALALLGPLVVAHALVVRREGWRRLGWILLPLALCAVAVRLAYPFLFAPSAGLAAGLVALEEGTLRQSGHLIQLGRFNGRGALVVGRTLWHYEPVALVLALVGAVALLPKALRARERAGDLLVLAAHALPYTVVLLLYQRTFERFVIPLLPYVALLAAYGLGALQARLTQHILLRRALLALAVALPLVLALRHAQVRAAPDSVSRAAAWIEAHLDPATTRIALQPPLDLPLAWSGPAHAWNAALPDPTWIRYPWAAYLCGRRASELPEPRWDLRRLPIFDAAARTDARGNPSRPLRSMGCNVLVVERFERGRQDPLLERIGSWAERQGQLLARFSPEGDRPVSLAPLTYVTGPPRTPDPHYAWRVLRAQCFGPVVEIYRLDP